MPAGMSGGDPMIAALLQPQAYPHPTSAITLLETHISWVLLTGTYAYKLKKPVNLGFVDFSSFKRRRHFCQEELRLNQRLAPKLYLDTVAIHGPPERANLQGTGPVIEIAIRMRQFDQGHLLPRALAAGLLTGELMEEFSDRLAAFHGSAALAPSGGSFGTPEAVVAPALDNLAVLERLQPDRQTLPRLKEWSHQEADRLQPVFAERLRRGRVREGHGDLHLGNLVLHQGEVVAFDCLEFSPALRWIDVLSDLAFLTMDLQQCGQPVWAGRVLNRWLIATGDYGSLATWRWYLTYRALVRAKVLALRLDQLAADHSEQEGPLRAQLDSYLDQAHRSSDASLGEALILTHGVSGSGKSRLAGQLCRMHGWIHLRSDVERRRLFGRWGSPVGPLRQGEAYSPELTAELYGQILPEAAEAILKAGLTVVVDATFLRMQQRLIFRSLAGRLRVPMLILDCSVTLDVARERIQQRCFDKNDPSEADVNVLIRQWQTMEPLTQKEASLRISGTDGDEVIKLLGERVPGVVKTTR